MRGVVGRVLKVCQHLIMDNTDGDGCNILNGVVE